MQTPAPSGLAPGFLVAAPALTDPNFAGSLVLMAEHHGEGALGFVVNRAGPVTVAEVLASVDEDLRRAAEANGRAGAPVLVGGPVQPERLWILFRPGNVAADAEGAVAVGDALSLGGSRELLEALVRAPGAGDPFLLLLGYAGWAPMQVEREVAAGAWVPLELDGSTLVFDVPLEKRWDTAVRRLGLEPGGFLVGGGGASA
ncbi:YqgE/AlgH family protein [Anaeromyxobacter terrae]|uniref:YqgE/AlgH family protein n=1 Tax=Anaeromyxobacter terrae TaxID=2925406 RepID=UPI001F592CF1|nr:YqgE/AlgH family protein [Anaeromyxobacter sp. SG22]